jgi:hypothetical protein
MATLTDSCTNIINPHDANDTKPVTNNDVSSNASVSSSNMATYDIAPAANPSPAGKYGTNFSTNINAGIAINGCGMLVNIAHSAKNTWLEELKT